MNTLLNCLLAILIYATAAVAARVSEPADALAWWGWCDRTLARLVEASR